MPLSIEIILANAVELAKLERLAKESKQTIEDCAGKILITTAEAVSSSLKQ